MANKNNVMDLLLNANNEEILAKRETQVEIPRLSRIFGAPFKVTLKALPIDEYYSIQQRAMEVGAHGLKKLDLARLQQDLVIASMVNPDLRNADLKAKLGAATPLDVVNKIFLAGELAKLTEAVTNLCGFMTQDEVDEEVKN